jgi:hypothetical protein
MAQVVPPQYYLRTSSFINDKDLFCVPYISLFTCEAEYIAATDAAREATWLRCLLAEIDPPGAPATSLPQSNEPNHLPPIPMAMDNQGAIALATLGSHNRRMRHIDVRYHYSPMR